MQVLELKQAAIERLDKLSPLKLIQVLDFMDFLLQRPAVPGVQEPTAPHGSPEDLLAIAGIWEFEPGELEAILQDIERSRLIEPSGVQPAKHRESAYSYSPPEL